MSESDLANISPEIAQQILSRLDMVSEATPPTSPQAQLSRLTDYTPSAPYIAEDQPFTNHNPIIHHELRRHQSEYQHTPTSLYRSDPGYNVPIEGTLPRYHTSFMQNPQFVHSSSVGSQANVPLSPPLSPNSEPLGPLPPGWEMAHTPKGRIYFINHLDKSTTFKDPRLESSRSVSSPNLNRPPAMQRAISQPLSTLASSNPSSPATSPPPASAIAASIPTSASHTGSIRSKKKTHKDSALNQLRTTKEENEKSFKGNYQNFLKQREQKEKTIQQKQMLDLKESEKTLLAEGKNQLKEMEVAHREEEKKLKARAKLEKRNEKLKFASHPRREVLYKEISFKHLQLEKYTQWNHNLDETMLALINHRKFNREMHSRKLRIFCENSETLMEFMLQGQSMESEHLLQRNKLAIRITKRIHELDRAEQFEQQKRAMESLQASIHADHKIKHKQYKAEEKEKRKEQEKSLKTLLKADKSLNKKQVQADQKQELETAWMTFLAELEKQKSADEHVLMLENQRQNAELKAGQEEFEQQRVAAYVEEHKKLLSTQCDTTWETLMAQHKKILQLFSEYEGHEKKDTADNYQSLAERSDEFLTKTHIQFVQSNREKFIGIFTKETQKDRIDIEKVERKSLRKSEVSPAEVQFLEERKRFLNTDLMKFQEDQRNRVQQTQCDLEQRHLEVKLELLKSRQAEEIEHTKFSCRRIKDLEEFYHKLLTNVIEVKDQRLRAIFLEIQIFSAVNLTVTPDARLAELPITHKNRLKVIDEKYLHDEHVLSSNHIQEYSSMYGHYTQTVERVTKRKSELNLEPPVYHSTSTNDLVSDGKSYEKSITDDSQDKESEDDSNFDHSEEDLTPRKQDPIYQVTPSFIKSDTIRIRSSSTSESITSSTSSLPTVPTELTLQNSTDTVMGSKPGVDEEISEPELISHAQTLRIRGSYETPMGLEVQVENSQPPRQERMPSFVADLKETDSITSFLSEVNDLLSTPVQSRIQVENQVEKEVEKKDEKEESEEEDTSDSEESSKNQDEEIQVEKTQVEKVQVEKVQVEKNEDHSPAPETKEDTPNSSPRPEIQVEPQVEVQVENLPQVSKHDTLKAKDIEIERLRRELDQLKQATIRRNFNEIQVESQVENLTPLPTRPEYSRSPPSSPTTRNFQVENSRRPNSSPGILPSSDKSRVQVEALYDFVHIKADQLDFKKGDIITVTDMRKAGWWKGILNGKSGKFPSNYCKIISENPLTSSDEPQPSEKKVQVRAMYDFVPTRDDQLAMRKGDVITVTKQRKSGWWRGELNGKTGKFPLNFTVILTDGNPDGDLPPRYDAMASPVESPRNRSRSSSGASPKSVRSRSQTEWRSSGEISDDPPPYVPKISSLLFSSAKSDQSEESPRDDLPSPTASLMEDVELPSYGDAVKTLEELDVMTGATGADSFTLEEADDAPPSYNDAVKTLEEVEDTEEN